MNQKKSLTYDAKGNQSGIGPIARIIFLLVAIWTITLLQANAQSKVVVNQSIQWTSFNSNIKLHKNYGLTVDGQFRFAEYASMQHQLRIGFELYLSKKFSFIPVHYSYIWNTPYGKKPAAFANNEHRIGQQFTFKHNVSRVAIQHRLRFEERFIQIHSRNTENQVIDEGYTNKQFRVRYRALANIPLNHAKMDPETYYISVWGEVFMSHGEMITYNDPDQSRVFIGPGYQFTKNFAIQTGFIYQYLIRANGALQENNMGLMFQLNYNFDLSKKDSQ